MGAYYQYVNLDRQEVISMSSLCNIKRSAYCKWSVQTAILQVLLGAPEYSFLHVPPLWGRWQTNRIAIECDEGGPQRSDEWTGNQPWPDIGMAFMAILKHTGHLDEWIKSRGLDGWVNPERIDEWIAEQKDKSWLELPMLGAGDWLGKNGYLRW